MAISCGSGSTIRMLLAPLGGVLVALSPCPGPQARTRCMECTPVAVDGLGQAMARSDGIPGSGLHALGLPALQSCPGNYRDSDHTFPRRATHRRDRARV